ncbi:MAG: DNA mismatch repair endonuclease MutH [Gammaproteobacteria bacterium]
MIKVSPPTSEIELLDRAWNIAGLTIKQLANNLDQKIPENLHRNKGWIGEILELALGATAGSKPEPDFQLINVELKTIPIKNNLKPKETTHVCTVPLFNTTGLSWETSLVKKKLSRVLWIPIEYDEKKVLAERKIGSPLLWSPTSEQENVLKTDWEEFMDLISLGEFDQITAHLGEALQIRPKAADSHALADGIGKEGKKIKTLPRGFYLRTSFTAAILAENYQLST